MRESPDIERAHQATSVLFELKGESLLQRQTRFGWFVWVAVAGSRQIENVPVCQPAVTSDVQLPGADAADRHANRFQVGMLIDSFLTSLGEHLDPLWLQLLVGRYTVVNQVLLGKWSGHRRQACGTRRQGGRSQTSQFDERTATHVGGTATAAKTARDGRGLLLDVRQISSVEAFVRLRHVGCSECKLEGRSRIVDSRASA